MHKTLEIWSPCWMLMAYIPSWLEGLIIYNHCLFFKANTWTNLTIKDPSGAFVSNFSTCRLVIFCRNLYTKVCDDKTIAITIHTNQGCFESGAFDRLRRTSGDLGLVHTWLQGIWVRTTKLPAFFRSLVFGWVNFFVVFRLNNSNYEHKWYQD